MDINKIKSQRDAGYYERDSYAGPVIVTLVAIVIIVGIIAGIVALVGATWSKVDAASAACVYNGGPFDNKSYKTDVAPGEGRAYQGFASSVIEYPVGIVQYDKSDGLPDVSVSVGGFTQTYSPVLNMTIATYKDDDGKPQACHLIEQHLRRLNATDFNDDVANSRWVQQFLNVRVAPAVRDTLPRVLSNGDPTDLFLNQDEARDKAAAKVGTLVTAALKTQLGDNYFCAPTYRYGQSVEACGTINVVLPEPVMNADDLKIIRAPQEARTRADNDIAVATEEARAAAGIATQRTQEAKSAEERADAEQAIAIQEGRTIEAQQANLYLWCKQLVELGQDCALVKAAENGDFPIVLGGSDTPVVIPVPTDDPPTPTTVAPAAEPAPEG